MARMKDPDRINKDFTIRVRVTVDEREEFLEKALSKGYKSVSEYIRSLVKADVEDSKKLSS